MTTTSTKRTLIGAALVVASGAMWAGVATLNPASAQSAPPNAVAASPAAEVAPALEVADDKEADTPIPAAELDRASVAALTFTKGGRVTDSSLSDQGNRYEVEVTLDDGGKVDVQLDPAFTVVSSEPEGAGE